MRLQACNPLLSPPPPPPPGVARRGPIVWVLGAEIQTLDTRTSGMSAVVASNYLLSFVIGQSFLSMLCSLVGGRAGSPCTAPPVGCLRGSGMACAAVDCACPRVLLGACLSCCEPCCSLLWSL
jgi:hypothetical protein